MNKPYVKIIENGLVSNPIDGAYLNEHPNRRERRSQLQKQRHRGNHKGVSLVTVREGNKIVAYFRTIQMIGNKIVNHYLKK